MDREILGVRWFGNVLAIGFLLLVLAGCNTAAEADMTKVQPQTIVPKQTSISTPSPVNEYNTPIVTVATLEATNGMNFAEVCVKTGSNDGVLNVREGPGMEFSVIATLPEGGRIKVIVPWRDGWFKIADGPIGTRGGWVKADYVGECE